MIDGQVIKEIGSFADLKAKYPEAEFVDAKGGVIMPGLINAHTTSTRPGPRPVHQRLQPHQFLRCWTASGGTSTGI